MQTYRIESDGAELFCREYGADDGPPVVLVHGGPGISGYMTSLGEHLADDFRLLDYDQRGTPRSDAIEPVTAEGHVEDLAAVVDAASDYGSVRVVGHSWGANLSLLHASEHPATTEVTVLVGGGPFDEEGLQKLSSNIEAGLTWDEFQRRNELLEIIEDESRPNDERAEAWREATELQLPAYQYNRDSVADLELDPYDVEGKEQSVAEQSRLFEEGILEERLGDIDDRVVAYHGAHDIIPAQPVLETLRERVRNIQTYEIPKAGHLPWLESTARNRFLDSLRDILAA